MKLQKLSGNNSIGRYAALVVICTVICIGTGLETTYAKPVSTVTCTSMRSMARIYMACGDYEKAQPLAEKALQMARTDSPSDAELTACMLDLAYLYKDQGMFAEAEIVCNEGLEMQARFLPKSHPQIAQTLRISAAIQRGLAKYEEAEATMELAIRTILPAGVEDDRTLGPYKVDLARILIDKADYVKAESCLSAAMTSIEAGYGPDHTYTAKVRCDVAQLQYLQGKIAEADNSVNRALKTLEKTYGPKHHFLVSAWMTRAQIEVAKGNHKAARSLLEKSLLTARNKRGAEHPMVGRILNQLGALQTETKQYAKAQDTLQQAVDVLTKSLGKGNDVTATASNNLAKVCLYRGKCDRAGELAAEALETMLSIFEPTHPRVAEVLDTMAQVNARIGIVARAN